MNPRRVCVYCASSRKCDPDYFEAARALGLELARQGLEVIYGGGRVGLMGALAEGALEGGGKVTGIIPAFMLEREWGHTGLTELKVVEDMHTRKSLMMRESDAFVALPGGSGTFEELFEVLTWKRLGFVTGPVVIANLKGYFDPCVALLERAIAERFMNEQHAAMWTVADSVAEVLEQIHNAPPWDSSAIEFAGV